MLLCFCNEELFDSTYEPLLAFLLFQQLGQVHIGIFSGPCDNNTSLLNIL